MAGNDYFNYVIDRLSNNDPTLRVVDLSYNGIDDEGARHLAAALKVNTILERLNLSYNNIGDEGVGYLAAALEANTHLEGVNLRLSIVPTRNFTILEILIN